tara:strand:- start:320 stop:1093 length:774 start_codon:yes stop_codon:yes gene_type:complete
MSGVFNLFWWGFFWFILFILMLGIGGFLGDDGGAFLGLVLFLILIGSYYYLVFRNSEERVKKAYAKLNDTLMNDEAIIEKGMDKRPFALFSRRQVFAITNSRIIQLKRRLLGGFKMNDFQWKDLGDVQVSENVLPSVCGSKLSFYGSYPAIEVFPDLETATRAYKYAQQEEQAWEEKRRIREMEESRAQVGGIMIGQSPLPSGSSQAVPANNNNSKSVSDITDELLKLKELLDQGVLSDSEFQEMKSKILSRTTQNF